MREDHGDDYEDAVSGIKAYRVCGACDRISTTAEVKAPSSTATEDNHATSRLPQRLRRHRNGGGRRTADRHRPHDRPDPHDLRQHMGRELDGSGGSRLLQAVHRGHGHPGAHGGAGVLREAEGPGAERQLRVGRDGHNAGGPAPRRSRRAGGAGRLDSREEGQALPERRVRQRPRLLRPRDQPGLPQGQVPAGRTEKLGRLLGRQEVSGQSLDAQQRGAYGAVRARRGRRAR